MNTIENTQLVRIQTVLSKRCQDRESRLAFLSTFFNRDVSSTKELSKIEADDLIYFLNTGSYKDNHWGYFDNNNTQHRTVLSLMRQAGWLVENDRHGEVPDIKRLSDFLKSSKSPVNKPLKEMTPQQLSKIIIAFEGIVKHKYNV